MIYGVRGVLPSSRATTMPVLCRSPQLEVQRSHFLGLCMARNIVVHRPALRISAGAEVQPSAEETTEQKRRVNWSCFSCEDWQPRGLERASEDIGTVTVEIREVATSRIVFYGFV